MIPQTPQIAMSAKKENDVMGLCLRERIRHSIFLCLALVTMFSMFLLTTVTVQADSVTINDQAGVLDALNTYTQEQLVNTAIAIGIDTVHRQLSIEAAGIVPLSDSEASNAVSAFRSNYDNGGDYTSATIAALDSVQNALSGYYNYNPFQCIGGLLGIVVFFVVVYFVGANAIRRRGSLWGGSYHGGGGYGGGHGGGGGGGHGGGAGGHF